MSPSYMRTRATHIVSSVRCCAKVLARVSDSSCAPTALILPLLPLSPLSLVSDVGRSCILVSIGGKNVMLDCGMHMGFNDEVITYLFL